VATSFYTVIFDENNTDEGSIDANLREMTVFTSIIPITPGGSLPSAVIGTLPKNPIRPGYNFFGWNTAANGSGTAFRSNTIVTENITVYAQWVLAPRHALNINRNFTARGSVTVGGIVSDIVDPITLQNVINGVPITITATPAIGFGFDNWTVVSGIVEFDNANSANTTVTLNSDATIRANFIPAEYYTLTVNYNPAGRGTVSPTTRSDVIHGVPVNITATPTNNTFRFHNWTVVSGTAVFYDANSANTTVILSSNATIRANFQRLREEFALYCSSMGTSLATNLNYNLSNNVILPATIEVYALGAGGGGQGGHWQEPMLGIGRTRGTGGAGGGGAAAYMRFETNTRETLRINLGRGGTGGAWVYRNMFQSVIAGGTGGNGGDTTVTWSGNTLTVQGGRGGGTPASTTNFGGGSGGVASTRPSAITTANWETLRADGGGTGSRDRVAETRGGSSAALRLTRGWFTYSTDTTGANISYRGGWITSGYFHFPGTGGGGSGGYSENNGIAGGNGQVRIRVSWWEN
jgi:uncharacterized repeat protein (TIGR02543 family)